jgi:hypothetical protein
MSPAKRSKEVRHCDVFLKPTQVQLHRRLTWPIAGGTTRDPGEPLGSISCQNYAVILHPQREFVAAADVTGRLTSPAFWLFPV